MTTITASCENCKYFENLNIGAKGFGECRINAPLIGLGQCAAFPLVRPGNWCGKWEQRP